MAVIDNTWKWRKLTPATTPPSRLSFGMVWSGDRVIMFGGLSDESGPFLNDLWEFYDDDWHQVTTDTVPDTRFDMQMVWADDRVYMTGGAKAGPTYFLDTWEYLIGADWTLIPTANYPDDGNVHYFPRSTARIATWDTVNSRMLLTAPYVTPDGTKTWQFDPVTPNWSLLTPATEYGTELGATGAHRLYPCGCWTGDRWIVANGVQLSGPGCGTRYNDIQEYPEDDAGWDLDIAATFPSAGTPYTSPFGTLQYASQSAAVWTGDRMFTYGGGPLDCATPAATVTDRQFQYDPVGVALEELLLTGTPAARMGHQMVWDGTRVFMFGGELGNGSGDIVHETWVLEPPLQVAPTYHRVYGLEIQLTDDGVEGPVTVRTSAQSQQA